TPSSARASCCTRASPPSPSYPPPGATRMPLADVPGVLTAAELAATVDSIADLQLPSGMIPWFPDGHADPWNHVEAAMALMLGDRRAEAERAYDWLVGQQRP